MIWPVLLGLGLALGTYEGIHFSEDLKERREVYALARAYADERRKPLLVVGAPKLNFNHPCGDITIDIDPTWLKYCPNGEIADVRDIPYPDKYFGASYCSHVLEHLFTVDDCYQALSELDRVSDGVFIVVPDKSSIAAWFWPGHHLWVIPNENGVVIEQR